MEIVTSFPEGFLWGAATSAYQCEGAAEGYGKKDNQQDVINREIHDEYGYADASVASDHYHHYKEDVALMAEIALQVHHLLGVRRLDMAPVEILLRPLVGVERLIPRQSIRRLHAGRRNVARLGGRDLLMADETRIVLGVIDRRLEMDRVPFRPAIIADSRARLDGVEGGAVDNPLGTRALYLSWTYYRIHGTHDTRKIGRRSSNGCIGLYNEHIEELLTAIADL